MSRDLGLGYIIISWGANFADFDHDGDQDLFVSNGDLNPNCSPMGNHYFDNRQGKFEELARLKGLADFGIGRGSVVFDIENDGDLDILVINQRPILTYPVPSTTRLYRNDSAQGNWVKIALKGIAAESDGLASRVEILAGGKRQIREIDGGGSSHLSQSACYAHFGIGEARVIDEIIVHWTGGNTQILKQQPVNQLIRITETPPAIWQKGWFWALLGLVGLLFILGKKWRLSL
jgi:hypothetical protein